MGVLAIIKADSTLFARICLANRKIRLVLIQDAIIETLQDFHVVGPFKCRWIGDRSLAHTANHFLNRAVFELIHPLFQVGHHFRGAANPMCQQLGSGHRHIGACHQRFDNVGCLVHPGG